MENSGCARYFIILFVLGWLYGCVYLSYIGLSEIVSYYYVKSWPTTEGLILNSQVLQKKYKMASGWSYSYTSHINYSYTVQGIVYESKRFSDDPYKKIDTVKFHAGSRVMVSYSPFKPSKAILYNNFNYDTTLALILGLIMIGVFMFLARYSILGKQLNTWEKIKTFVSGMNNGTFNIN